MTDGMRDRKQRRLHASWRAASLAGIVAVLAVVGTASASWYGFGAGFATGTVARLTAPSVSGTAGSGTVALTWTAVPALGSGTMTYYVRRNGGDPAGDCPKASAPAAVTSCTDNGLNPGLDSYTVTAVWHSWTSTSAVRGVNVTVGPLDHFVLSPATTTPTAGQADVITISAVDAAGSVLTDFTRSYCLTFSGPNASPNGTAPTYPGPGSDSCSATDSYVAFVAGVSKPTVTLYRAENTTLKVADSLGHGSTPVAMTVGPARVASFTIPTPGSQTAGVAFQIKMSALDAWGNGAVGYTGTKCITFSGPDTSVNGTKPLYPGPGASCSTGQSAVAFTGGNASGIPITLYKDSTTTVLTGTDASASATGSTVQFRVFAAGAASFSIAGPGPQIAGAGFNLTISAVDGYGGTDTTYAGTKCITFTGPSSSPNGNAPGYPVHGTCLAGQSAVTFAGGIGTASITLYNASATTTLTATDPALLTGTSPVFAVTGAATIAGLQLSSGSVTSVVAGNPVNLTITGIDAYGNTSSYSGTVAMTYTGAVGVAGSPYVPTVTDSGGTARTFGTATTIAFTSGTATVGQGKNGAAVLYAGGSNSFHVSDGTHISANIVITVTVQAKQVAAGGAHTCAVLSYGGVECWGRNNDGQLGNNTTTNASTPVAVSGLTNAVAVTAGEYHTCALLGDGSVRCWGYNSNGQLGNNTTITSLVPVNVSGLSGVTSLSAGALHTCAVSSSGVMRCWGSNAYGQLGSNTTTDSLVPVAVQSPAAGSAISAGWYHTCAITTAGVQCWGRNNYYQLGDGTTQTRTTPVTVAGLSAVAIAAGGYHTCVITTSHVVECWGRANYGQVGNGGTATQTTPAATGITAGTVIAAGVFHSCATLSNGYVDCWGYNNHGQIGDNSTTNRTSPTRAGSISNATQVSAGGATGATIGHTAALLADGTVDDWGDNAYGQLGNGTTTDSHVPVAVTLK